MADYTNRPDTPEDAVADDNWPTRPFGEGKNKPSPNTGTALGSKGNPPSTEDIPDTSPVDVDRAGEGFDPANA